MNLAVYGYTDKRVIILSLIKVLQTTGEILLVSDDRHYIRYTEDKVSYGYFLNTAILVTDASPDQVMTMDEIDMQRYKHVIYDLRTHVYEGADINIYVAPVNIDEDERIVMMSLRNVKPIYIKYSGMKVQGDLIMKKVSKKEEKKMNDEMDGIISEEEDDDNPVDDDDFLVITEFPESLRMKKGVNIMRMTHPLICQLEISESTRTCPIFSDSQLAKVIHTVVGEKLGCDLKLINALLKEKL